MRMDFCGNKYMELTFWAGASGEKRECKRTQEKVWAWGLKSTELAGSTDRDLQPSSPAPREPQSPAEAAAVFPAPTTTLERHTGLTHVYILHMLGMVSPSTYKVLHQLSCSPLPSLKFLPGIPSKYLRGRKLHTGFEPDLLSVWPWDSFRQLA